MERSAIRGLTWRRDCPGFRCASSGLHVRAALRRLLLRREAAVERLAARRHVFEQLRRGEARAVFGFEFVAQLDELPRAHEVDIGQRTAGERREAEAEDR